MFHSIRQKNVGYRIIKGIGDFLTNAEKRKGMCIGGKDSSVNVEVVFVESGEQSAIIAILSSLTALREISRCSTVDSL